MGKNFNRIYLDYAATTPVDPRVFKAMRPYFSEKFGNPGSVHKMGQEAIAAVDEAREKVAKAIGGQFREVIFTASATEANNLVLRGVVKHAMQKMRMHANAANKNKSNSYHSDKFVDSHRLRIIISAIEHESILETAKDLEKDGAEVIYLPVNREGLVDLKKLKNSLNERTVLVSIMYANNEVGTIQPIAEIVEILAAFRVERSAFSKDSKKQSSYTPYANRYPLLHTDAVQAFQYLNCNVAEFGVDMMTLSSHKIYGPKGAGALYARRYGLSTNHYPLATIISGGGQEYGLRSGTENVPAVVGFGKAAELLQSYPQELERIAGLRDYFWAKLKKLKPNVKINGPAIMLSHKKRYVSSITRLPNNLNVYFPDSSAEELLVKLDMAGIEASAGSACAARSLNSSYVLKAMGFSEKRAKSSLRFSLGRPTTKQDIDEMLYRIKNI